MRNVSTFARLIHIKKEASMVSDIAQCENTANALHNPPVVLRISMAQSPLSAVTKMSQHYKKSPFNQSRILERLWRKYQGRPSNLAPASPLCQSKSWHFLLHFLRGFSIGSSSTLNENSTFQIDHQKGQTLKKQLGVALQIPAAVIKSKRFNFPIQSISRKMGCPDECARQMRYGLCLCKISVTQCLSGQRTLLGWSQALSRFAE